ARSADFRQRVEDRVAALADAPDDADQRIPADPDRAEGAPVPGARDGEVLFRRGVGEAAGISTGVGREKKGGQSPFEKGSEPFSTLNGAVKPACAGRRKGL